MTPMYAIALPPTGMQSVAIRLSLPGQRYEAGPCLQTKGEERPGETFEDIKAYYRSDTRRMLRLLALKMAL